jgi:hypothetical protein
MLREVVAVCVFMILLIFRLMKFQSIYIETSVRNKCRCSFYCALLKLHVSAPIGGHLQLSVCPPPLSLLGNGPFNFVFVCDLCQQKKASDCFFPELLVSCAFAARSLWYSSSWRNDRSACKILNLVVLVHFLIVHEFPFCIASSSFNFRLKLNHTT